MWMSTATFWRETLAFQMPGAVQKRSSRPTLSGIEGKSAVSFARGTYLLYVSAHGPKRAKSVRQKVRKTDENAAGGFFQQRH